MGRALDVSLSYISSVMALGAGMRVHRSAEPASALVLYEFESCPFCRKVREGLSALDLDALLLPCPPGGRRYRPEAERLGGKQQFPLLVDGDHPPLYESEAILRTLSDRYAGGALPATLRTGPVSSLRAGLSSLRRVGTVRARPSRVPDKPLELYNYEASPYCRLVREELCSLELWHKQINVARGSRKRTDFVARSGKMMVPFLVDPNTGESLFESADIIRYLRRTYAE